MSEQTTGDRIRASRMNLAYSQQELADKTGLSLRTIQRIENGETIARGDSLQRVAAALGVEVKSLFENSGELHQSLPTNARGETAGRRTGTDRLRNDCGLIFLLKISPLTYLIFPLLALLSPFIIGKIFEDKIEGVKSKAKVILIQQSIWLLLLGLAYAYLLQKKVLGFDLPMPQNPKSPVIITTALYYLNAVFITGSAIWWLITDKKQSLLTTNPNPSNS